MAKTKTLYRNAVVERSAIDEEARTVNLSFSSEEPYERYNSRFGGNYFEVLGHDENEVDLTFLNSGRAPLLKDHDTTKQIGVVREVTLSSGRGYALVEFSQNEEGTREFTDVLGGIRQNVSVGYHVLSEKVVGEKDGKKVVRASFRPVEISTVAIPADESVGVGRSADEPEVEETSIITPLKEETKMTIENEKTLNVEEIKREAATAERARVAGINELGQKFGMGAKANQFIRDGKEVEEFKSFVLENLDMNSKTTEIKAEKSDIGLSEKEVKQYSVLRAIRSQLGDRKMTAEAGFELEVSRAVAEKTGQEARGVLVPHDVLSVRALEAGGAANGANFVANNLIATSFIELLRNRLVVVQAGATMLTNLRGNVQIPRQSGTATAYWLTPEGAAPTTSVQTMDQVTLTPRTVGATTDFTRQFLLQSSVDVENFVKADLAKVLALSVDSKALYGNTAAAAGEPTGVKHASGINTYDIAAGTVTYANAHQIIAKVEAANALEGSLKFITHPTIKATMATTSIDSGSGRYVYENGKVAGYDCLSSAQVTNTDVFFGNWADMLIGMWGSLDLVVDPYALSTSGGIRVVALQSVDVALRHPLSFVYAV